MSLIILSNDYETETNKVQTAYNWRNYMTNSINIKKNSEIAVVSAKIVKNNQIIVPKDFQFYCYWGRGYDGDTLANQKSVRALIRTDQNLNDDNVNYNTLAQSLTQALKYGFVYPNLHEESKVEVAYNASKLFTGFKYYIIDKETDTDQSGSLDDLMWEHLYNRSHTRDGKTYGDMEFNDANKRITAGVDSIFNVMQYDARPMSLKSDESSGGGECHFNIKNVSVDWCVGLKAPDQRGGLKHPRNNEGDYGFSGFSAALRFPSSNLYNMLKLNNFDFVAYCQVVGGKNTLFMATLIDKTYYPVDYFSDNANVSKTQVEITDQKILKFITQGEEVRVAITDKDGLNDKMLVDQTLNSKNTHNFKAITLTTCALVPFVGLYTKDDYVVIDQLNGAKIEYEDADNGFQPREEDEEAGLFANPFGCWATRAISNNNSQNFTAIERQYGFQNRNESFTRKLDFYGNYDGAFIFSSSDKSLHSARGMATLGFENPITKDWTQSGNQQWLIESSVKPETGNKNSLFVRINNLTTRSFNAGLHSESKIIYALPRFGNDSNGQDVGALFFEPGEKTYIELGNTNDINISSLDVSIVNENETLAYDLTGKSVIVVHIRQVK